MWKFGCFFALSCLQIVPNKSRAVRFYLFFCFSHLVFSKSALKGFFCPDWLLVTDIVVGHVNSQVTIKSKNSHVVVVKLVCTSSPLELFAATHELEAWSSPAARAEEYFLCEMSSELLKNLGAFCSNKSVSTKSMIKKNPAIITTFKYLFHKWTRKAVFVFIFFARFSHFCQVAVFSKTLLNVALDSFKKIILSQKQH